MLARLLRLWTLGSRFVLVLFLAKYLPVSDVGIYGVFAGIVAFSIYLLGVDFFSYTTREMISSDRLAWPSILRNHFTIILINYLPALPILTLVFSFNILPWEYAAWFLFILATEHLGLECERLLIAAQDQMAASILVTLRQGLLPLIVCPALALLPDLRTTSLVLNSWLALNILGLSYGLASLIRVCGWTTFGELRWSWIRAGLRVSMLYFCGSIISRAYFTLDRQFVAAFGSIEVVAPYTLAMTLGAGVSSVVAVAVHQFGYPRLVESANKVDWAQFRRGLKQMTAQSFAIVFTAGGISVLAGNLLLGWIDRPEYTRYSWMFAASVLVNGIYSIALVPHYGMYALRYDRSLLAIIAGSAVVLLACAFGLLGLGAPAPLAILGGLLAASLMLLVTRSCYLSRALRTH